MNQPPEPNIIQSGINNISDRIKTVGSSISETGDSIATTVASIRDTGSSVASSTLDTVKTYLPEAPAPSNGSSFSLSDYTTMSSEFLESNSYIARTAFVLLIVFTFFVLLRLGTIMIKYFVGRSTDPTKVVDGMINGNDVKTIPQGPGEPNIYRSNNELTGIEFTWSVNLYVKDQTTTSLSNIHIFSKGSIPVQDAPNSTINKAPGLYLNKSANSLVVYMDTLTGPSSNETITVDNIPHNKWLNVIIRCKNRVIDVYVNGQIAKSQVLSGVPKQNYGSVYVFKDQQFTGYLSDLLYYKHALTINEINSLMTKSVNLKMLSPDSVDVTGTNYLGFKWFV